MQNSQTPDNIRSGALRQRDIEVGVRQFREAINQLRIGHAPKPFTFPITSALIRVTVESLGEQIT